MCFVILYQLGLLLIVSYRKLIGQGLFFFVFEGDQCMVKVFLFFLMRYYWFWFQFFCGEMVVVFLSFIFIVQEGVRGQYKRKELCYFFCQINQSILKVLVSRFFNVCYWLLYGYFSFFFVYIAFLFLQSEVKLWWVNCFRIVLRFYLKVFGVE